MSFTIDGSAQEAAPVVEDAKPVEAPKAEQSESATRQYEIRAQREKEYVRKMQSVKAEAQKLQQQRQEIEAMYKKVQEFESAKKNARLNPDSYLGAAGLSYEELTQYKMNNNNPTVDAKFQSLEEKLEAKFREQEERELKRQEDMQMQQRQAEERAVQDFHAKVDDYVDTNKDKYKFVHAYEGQDLIKQAALEYARRTGKVIDIEKATEQAETYLKELWLKGKEFMESGESKEQPKVQSAQRTLSNDMNPSQNPGLVSPKNDRERMQRALAKLG